MKLYQVATIYIAHKQSIGMRFITETRTLKSFCMTLGDVEMDLINFNQVCEWLRGNGVITRFYHRKLDVLRGFYRFALARDYATVVPLPKVAPQNTQIFVPYIYSRAEITRLLAATVNREKCNLSSLTCRTLLLLLYGTGLRIGEAISLDMADVNLPEAVLTIRETKFYKTRLVPIGRDLKVILAHYLAQRHLYGPLPLDAPFLLTQRGKRLSRAGAEFAFRQLCEKAQVQRNDISRHQPRLHDIRHSFAVTRLVSWYRDGADVQRLLPQLATYLGHVHIAATQPYLTMTPELLQLASHRFERFALGGDDDE